MPVVALPADNTERWWMVYQVNGDTHRMMVRTGDGGVPTAISNAFHGILNRMAGSLNEVTPLGLERALRGSNVRNPFAWTNAATYGLGNADSNDDRDKAISCVGRSSGGHKVKFFLFGFKNDADGDYRTDTTENAGVADTVGYLNGATGFALAIDGLQPVWKSYVNIKVNDHWVKVHRG